jgi:hypothetical protein
MVFGGARQGSGDKGRARSEGILLVTRSEVYAMCSAPGSINNVKVTRGFWRRYHCGKQTTLRAYEIA